MAVVWFMASRLARSGANILDIWIIILKARIENPCFFFKRLTPKQALHWPYVVRLADGLMSRRLNHKSVNSSSIIFQDTDLAFSVFAARTKKPHAELTPIYFAQLLEET
jgi:hypothetical protein